MPVWVGPCLQPLQTLSMYVISTWGTERPVHSNTSIHQAETRRNFKRVTLRWELDPGRQETEDIDGTSERPSQGAVDTDLSKDSATGGTSLLTLTS